MIFAFVVLGVWIASATLAAGIMFPDFQSNFPRGADQRYRGDLAFAWGMGLTFGPIALVVAFFLSGFAEHGIRWR